MLMAIHCIRILNLSARNNMDEYVKKLESKKYTNTRCGHCGKFGHHHSEHKGERLGDNLPPHEGRFDRTGLKRVRSKYGDVYNTEHFQVGGKSDAKKMKAGESRTYHSGGKVERKFL